MNDTPVFYVTHGDERARVYGAGGIGFDSRVRGIGWVVDDEPSPVIAQAALAVRAAMFPHLAPIGGVA